MRRVSAVRTMAAVSLLAVLIFGVQAIAAPGFQPLNWGANVNPGECEQGRLVINVTYGLSTVDSGLGGNWWADDYPNRHLQVWYTGVDEAGNDTYCALIQDTGQFVTRDGTSPGGAGTVSGGIRGTYQGGARMIITGVLNPSPTYPTRGHMGPFEYLVDGDIVSAYYWMNEYFTTWSAQYAWWGYTYSTPRNGRWVNSIDGTYGDIAD